MAAACTELARVTLPCAPAGSFVVWDVRRGARMSGHHTRMGGINGVGLGRDQVQVVSIGSDQQLTFWDLRESHPVQVSAANAGAAGHGCADV